MHAGGTTYIRHGSKRDVFRLWYLSDIHWMSAACAEDRVRRDIQAIADDPFSFWIGGGDYADFISHQDKRFDPDAVSERVSVRDLARLGMVAYEQVRDLFRPIAGQCLGLVEGNHERKYSLAMEQRDRHGWLCQELGAANLGYSALIDLAFVRAANTRIPRIISAEERSSLRQSHCETFRIWCHHGAGYAMTKGGKINRLSAFMNAIDADIYMMGHVHDQTGTRESVIAADRTCTKLIERQRLGIISGSYLKTYSQGVTTYAEQRGYRPTTLGAAWVTIRPDTREIEGRI